jgi:hypothetical protein
MADKLRRKFPTCQGRVTNAIASGTDAVEIGTREVQLALAQAGPLDPARIINNGP